MLWLAWGKSLDLQGVFFGWSLGAAEHANEGRDRIQGTGVGPGLRVESTSRLCLTGNSGVYLQVLEGNELEAARWTRNRANETGLG